jgi:hypothetical protein
VTTRPIAFSKLKTNCPVEQRLGFLFRASSNNRKGKEFPGLRTMIIT